MVADYFTEKSGNKALISKCSLFNIFYFDMFITLKSTSMQFIILKMFYEEVRRSVQAHNFYLNNFFQ